MKRLLIGATILATMSVVTRTVAKRKENTISLHFVNRNELDVLLSDTKFYAGKLNNSLRELKNFEPNLNQD